MTENTMKENKIIKKISDYIELYENDIKFLDNSVTPYVFEDRKKEISMAKRTIKELEDIKRMIQEKTQ